MNDIRELVASTRRGQAMWIRLDDPELRVGLVAFREKRAPVFPDA